MAFAAKKWKTCSNKLLKTTTLKTHCEIYTETRWRIGVIFVSRYFLFAGVVSSARGGLGGAWIWAVMNSQFRSGTLSDESCKKASAAVYLNAAYGTVSFSSRNILAKMKSQQWEPIRKQEICSESDILSISGQDRNTSGRPQLHHADLSVRLRELVPGQAIHSQTLTPPWLSQENSPSVQHSQCWQYGIQLGMHSKDSG